MKIWPSLGVISITASLNCCNFSKSSRSCFGTDFSRCEVLSTTTCSPWIRNTVSNVRASSERTSIAGTSLPFSYRLMIFLDIFRRSASCCCVRRADSRAFLICSANSCFQPNINLCGQSAHGLCGKASQILGFLACCVNNCVYNVACMPTKVGMPEQLLCCNRPSFTSRA